MYKDIWVKVWDVDDSGRKLVKIYLTDIELEVVERLGIIIPEDTRSLSINIQVVDNILIGDRFVRVELKPHQYIKYLLRSVISWGCFDFPYLELSKKRETSGEK